jgi:hypothetical protein
MEEFIQNKKGAKRTERDERIESAIRKSGCNINKLSEELSIGHDALRKAIKRIADKKTLAAWKHGGGKLSKMEKSRLEKLFGKRIVQISIAKIKADLDKL